MKTNGQASRGVNPHFFFAGGMCREEATSALLATLLEQSTQFLQGFFDLCGIPAFAVQKIDVEQQFRDVTVYGDDQVLFIENKISAASKTENQLLQYYDRLKQAGDYARIHSVYLSPKRSIGKSEVDRIPTEPGEIAVSIAWSDLLPLAQKLSDFDSMFAIQGIESVLNAIRKRKVSPAREYSDEQIAIREILHAIQPTVNRQFPNYVDVVFGTEYWSYGPISFIVVGESLLSDAGTVEMKLRYQFNLQSKNPKDHREEAWQRAKIWWRNVTNAESWNGFVFNGSRMSLEEIICGTAQEVQAQLAAGAIKHLSKVEKESGIQKAEVTQ